jgi:hypothetical protein
MTQTDITQIMIDVSDKLEAIMTPGIVAEMEPDEADIAGAFPDDSMSIEDALEASQDMEA